MNKCAFVGHFAVSHCLREWEWEEMGIPSWELGGNGNEV